MVGERRGKTASALAPYEAASQLYLLRQAVWRYIVQSVFAHDFTHYLPSERPDTTLGKNKTIPVFLKIFKNRRCVSLKFLLTVACMYTVYFTWRRRRTYNCLCTHLRRFNKTLNFLVSDARENGGKFKLKKKNRRTSTTLDSVQQFTPTYLLNIN